MKTKYWLLICAAVGLICFFAGRSVITVKETVRIVEGKTIRDSIPVPYPVTEYIPPDPKLIYKRDTTYRDKIRIITETVDTAAIIMDYITKRQYAFNVFDNEYGTFMMIP